MCILISQNYGQYILYLVYIQIKEARISGSHTKIKKEREREKKRKRERKKERTNKRTNELERERQVLQKNVDILKFCEPDLT